MEACFICKAGNAKIIESHALAYFIDCPRCKKYRISSSATAMVQHYEPSYLLSAAVRYLNENGQEIYIHTNNIDKIIDSVPVPSGPLEQMDLILNYIAEKEEHIGAGIRFHFENAYPIAFAKNEAEFDYFFQLLRDMDLIEALAQQWRLTHRGWEYIYELRKEKRDSDQAFMAMWFDNSMIEPYENGFKKALEETGYNPLNLMFVRHNDNIVNLIIAEIKKSGLLVADFTGNKGGVYYEAGFARGLGIPVIYTCKYEKDIEKTLHFDTQQIQHIFWKDSEDLYNQLKNQIEATIVRKKK